MRLFKVREFEILQEVTYSWQRFFDGFTITSTPPNRDYFSLIQKNLQKQLLLNPYTTDIEANDLEMLVKETISELVQKNQELNFFQTDYIKTHCDNSPEFKELQQRGFIDYYISCLKTIRVQLNFLCHQVCLFYLDTFEDTGTVSRVKQITIANIKSLCLDQVQLSAEDLSSLTLQFDITPKSNANNSNKL